VPNLRDLAAADHRSIVEDVAGGFGRALTFIDPSQRMAVVNGFWNDIGQAMDPMTGSMIAATVAFVRVTFGALREAGFGVPLGVTETDKSPWLVEYTDMGGRKHLCKIVEVRKDRSIDAVDCYLASYKP